MPIIKPSTAFKAGADWVSAEVRAYMKDQTPIHVDTVQDVRDNDFEQARWLFVKATGKDYRLDLNSAAPDDGDTVLVDNIGRRYVVIPTTGAGSPWDVQVPDLAARSAYDGEDAGFVVLVSDVAGGRAGTYTKNSSALGDWSDVAWYTGPTGQGVQGDPGPIGPTGPVGAQGPAYKDYGVNIYSSSGVAAPGSYDADPFAPADSTIAKVFAKLTDADSGSSLTFALLIDGVMVDGPRTVVFGSIIDVDGLDIEIAEGGQAVITVTNVTGTVRGVFIRYVGDDVPDLTVKSNDGSITNIIKISQTDYDGLVSPDPKTLYVIV